MSLRLDDLAPDDPGIGGKAAGLARARAAGVAVPPGVVVRPGAAAPADLGPGPWIVRSSATIEDAAPGIFATLRDVEGAAVPAAVAAVRASRDAPTARAYLAARRIAQAEMAVIVQRQIDGPRGTAWSQGGEVMVEVGEERALVSGAEVHGRIAGIAPATIAAVAEAARTLEEALGGAADVEWVLEQERLWIVQARRIPAVARAAIPAEALAFSAAEPDVVWTWDAEHNPAPLSPAQAGLVELVDAAAAAPSRQRVVLGYLYYAPAEPAPAAHAVPDPAPIFAALEADLGRMGGDLEQTLAAYLDFYRRYARELRPALAHGSALSLPPPPLADLAPAWDVAAPTYGEGLAIAAPPAWPRALRDADDFIFARAQAGVRRALLALAARLALHADDVLYLPLAEVRAAAARGAAPPEATARAAAARAELARLAALAPPLQIVAGKALFGAPPGAGTALRGVGNGGQARGRVLKLDAHLPATASGRVLVAATLIPPMAPLLVGARAVVAEHGGLLGHGVALARELGIPCVVGCVGALTSLFDGDEVWVDADAGVVVRL